MDAQRNSSVARNDVTLSSDSSTYSQPWYLKDRVHHRHKVIFLVLVLIMLYALSLCIGVTSYTVYPPMEVINALGVWFKTTFDHLFFGKSYTALDLIGMSPCFYQVIDRFGVTFIALICGIILSVSGMVYQCVFRNPIAAPTMLGVSSGLNLGLLVFVWIYGATAIYATVPHFLYAYGGAIVVLIVVLALARIINGTHWFSVVDMLLVGSIVSQLLGAIVLYVSYYVFDSSQWLIFATVNEVLSVETAPVAYAFLIVAFLLSFIPLYLLRFRLNALSFTPEESGGLGVNLSRLRYLALFLATIMIIAAMAHSGMVGMAALIVPFVSRSVFGAETKKQMTGNILIGALVIVACRGVADLLTIVLWGMGLTFAFPIGIVASLVCLPAFVWIIALQQRTWE